MKTARERYCRAIFLGYNGRITSTPHSRVESIVIANVAQRDIRSDQCSLFAHTF